MLTVVLVFNLLVVLICLYAALRVWELRLTLAKVADTLESIEHSTHKVLDGAPEAIVKGQMGVYQLRQKYQQIEPQLQQIRKALALLSVGQFVWQFVGQRRSLFDSKTAPRRRASLSKRGARRF